MLNLNVVQLLVVMVGCFVEFKLITDINWEIEAIKGLIFTSFFGVLFYLTYLGAGTL